MENGERRVVCEGLRHELGKQDMSQEKEVRVGKKRCKSGKRESVTLEQGYRRESRKSSVSREKEGVSREEAGWF